MTFASFYELFNPLSTVGKSRYVCQFDGNALSPEWTKQDVTGTGSGAMADSIDGGFQVTSGATSGNETDYGFNNARQFNNTSSTLIAVIQALSNTSSVSYVGFGSNTGLAYNANNNSIAFAVCDSANVNFSLRTADQLTNSEDTSSGVAIDTSWHTHELVLGASNVKYYIDGSLKITKSSNLPNFIVEPIFGVKTTTSSAKTTGIKYLEAFNV